MVIYRFTLQKRTCHNWRCIISLRYFFRNRFAFGNPGKHRNTPNNTSSTQNICCIYLPKRVIVSRSHVSIFQSWCSLKRFETQNKLWLSCKMWDLRGPAVFKLYCEVVLWRQSWCLTVETDHNSISSLFLSPVYWCHPRTSRNFVGRMLPSHSSGAW